MCYFQDPESCKLGKLMMPFFVNEMRTTARITYWREGGHQLNQKLQLGCVVVDERTEEEEWIELQDSL